MGYYTQYTLYVEVKECSQMENIMKRIKEVNKKEDSFLYPFIGDDEIECFQSDTIPILCSTNIVYQLDSEDEATWYDHEMEMRGLSKEFPEILFKLSGEGEEVTDVWNKYFLNGKVQDCQAEIFIPEFDIKKLI